MKKSLQKSSTVASLTARITSASILDGAANPWLTKQVAKRLEEGQALLVDMATDLPFATVLRGRVAPPKENVLSQAEPLAKIVHKFAPALPLPIDATYLRDRRAFLDRLAAFEQACENFLGLIKRARAVMAAQLERAMRTTYSVALEASATNTELAQALQPLGPALAAPVDKPQKK